MIRNVRTDIFQRLSQPGRRGPRNPQNDENDGYDDVQRPRFPFINCCESSTCRTNFPTLHATLVLVRERRGRGASTHFPKRMWGGGIGRRKLFVKSTKLRTHVSALRWFFPLPHPPRRTLHTNKNRGIRVESPEITGLRRAAIWKTPNAESWKWKIKLFPVGSG